MLTHLMNYSEHGAIAQAFIMNAVLSAAQATVAASAEALPQNGFINPEAWVGAAKEIVDKLEANWNLP